MAGALQVARHEGRDTAVIFLAGLQPALRIGKQAAGESKTRFRLGNVGAGQVADLEAVAGGLQVGFEDADLILIQLDAHAVANHVHIGGDRLGERVAFGCPQVGAAGLDPCVGGAHRIANGAARIERHGYRGADAEVPSQTATPQAGRIVGQHVLIDPGGRRYLRTAGGAGDGAAFVGRAQRPALSHDRRIRLVGRDQSVAQRLRRPQGNRRGRRDRNRRRRSGAARRLGSGPSTPGDGRHPDCRQQTSPHQLHSIFQKLKVRGFSKPGKMAAAASATH